MYSPTVVRGRTETYQFPNNLHDPLASASVRRISDDPDKSEFCAYTQNRPLSCHSGSVLLLSLLLAQCRHSSLRGRSECRTQGTDQGRRECCRETAV